MNTNPYKHLLYNACRDISMFRIDVIARCAGPKEHRGIHPRTIVKIGLTQWYSRCSVPDIKYPDGALVKTAQLGEFPNDSGGFVAAVLVRELYGRMLKPAVFEPHLTEIILRQADPKLIALAFSYLRFRIEDQKVWSVRRPCEVLGRHNMLTGLSGMIDVFNSGIPGIINTGFVCLFDREIELPEPAPLPTNLLVKVRLEPSSNRQKFVLVPPHIRGSKQERKARRSGTLAVWPDVRIGNKSLAVFAKDANMAARLAITQHPDKFRSGALYNMYVVDGAKIMLLDIV